MSNIYRFNWRQHAHLYGCNTIAGFFDGLSDLYLKFPEADEGDSDLYTCLFYGEPAIVKAASLVGFRKIGIYANGCRARELVIDLEADGLTFGFDGNEGEEALKELDGMLDMLAGHGTDDMLIAVLPRENLLYALTPEQALAFMKAYYAPGRETFALDSFYMAFTTDGDDAIAVIYWGFKNTEASANRASQLIRSWMETLS